MNSLHLRVRDQDITLYLVNGDHKNTKVSTDGGYLIPLANTSNTVFNKWLFQICIADIQTRVTWRYNLLDTICFYVFFNKSKFLF
jgi:hypothetical protein